MNGLVAANPLISMKIKMTHFKQTEQNQKKWKKNQCFLVPFKFGMFLVVSCEQMQCEFHFLGLCQGSAKFTQASVEIEGDLLSLKQCQPCFFSFPRLISSLKRGLGQKHQSKQKI